MGFGYEVESKIIKKKETLCFDAKLRCPDTIKNRKIMWAAIDKLNDANCVEGETNE